MLCSVDIHLGLPLLSLGLDLLVYFPLGFDLRLDIHDGPVGLRWSVEVVGSGGGVGPCTIIHLTLDYDIGRYVTIDGVSGLIRCVGNLEVTDDLAHLFGLGRHTIEYPLAFLIGGLPLGFVGVGTRGIARFISTLLGVTLDGGDVLSVLITGGSTLIISGWFSIEVGILIRCLSIRNCAKL